MPDPFLAAARELLLRSQREMREAIAGLPPDALNWRPAGDDTNSIAVLATHSLHSTRYWLSVAVDEPLPDRDRDSEFQAETADDTALLQTADTLFDACLALVDKSRVVDWSALRQHWDPDTGRQLFAAWCFVHALEHLGEHGGQMLLTRQLWEERQKA